MFKLILTNALFIACYKLNLIVLSVTIILNVKLKRSTTIITVYNAIN